MTILRAADLSLPRGADALWRKRIGVPGALQSHNPGDPGSLARRLGLPSSGFASPLGFWLAPAEVWVNPPPYSLELAPAPRPKAKARLTLDDIPPGSHRGQRIVLAAHRKTRTGSEKGTRAGNGAGTGTTPNQPSHMVLDVDGNSARLAIDEAAWPEGAQAGLLAIATSWRLDAIDHAFDSLMEQVRAGIGSSRANLSFPRFRRASSGFANLQREGRSLILNLADFEGPLTDPLRFLASRESARIYRRLCARLGLFARRDRIDERAELLEGAIDTLAARRDHRQVILLETLIIALLAADIALSQFLWSWE